MDKRMTNKTPDNIKVSAETLFEDCVQVLVKASGMSIEDANIVSANLIFANLRGTDTHGVTRLGIYLDFLKNGNANVNHRIKIVSDNKMTALVDADNALGQIGAQYGMNLAIERCREHGLSWINVANSGHIGALAYWSKMALTHDMIGICFANTATIMAAHGSREKTLGNTPIAIAAPSNDNSMPLILDMALSKVARGNLSVAAKEKQSIPLDWAIDNEGVPTTDPEAGLLGSVLPIGGYKGSGLALMLEVLAGVLSGSPIGKQKGSLVPPNFERPLGLSHTFMALKIENFIPVTQFKDRIEVLITEIKSSAISKNSSEVLVPNEKEFRIEKQRKKEGVPLSETLFKELKGFSEKYQVPFSIE